MPDYIATLRNVNSTRPKLTSSATTSLNMALNQTCAKSIELCNGQSRNRPLMFVLFLALYTTFAIFLPKLADHMVNLTLLTTKEAWKSFPTWTTSHQNAFEAIKALVISADLHVTLATGAPVRPLVLDRLGNQLAL
jgi:hypothetical protein